MYASIACTIASTPVAAVTDGGSPTVSSASNTARSGNSVLETMPAFVVSPVVIIEIGVTSDPVPAVVGIWIKGSLGLVIWSTPYISVIGVSLPESAATNFATSIELPPPTPITPSMFCCFAYSTAPKTTCSGGSAFISEKIDTLILEFCSMPSTIGLIRPNSTNPWSVTISTLLMPSDLHFSERFREAPSSQKMALQVVNVKEFML